jgi:hypothetical protein
MSRELAFLESDPFDAAVLNHTFIELHNEGIALAKGKHFDRALTCFDRALGLRPECADTLTFRAGVLAGLGRLSDALTELDRTLSVQPGYELAINMRTQILQKEPIDAAPGLPFIINKDPHILHAAKLLQKGDLKAGFAKWMAHPAQWPCSDQMWRGENVAGKKVCVWPDGGFGDTMQFARYLPLLAARGAQVIVHMVPPTLRELICTLPGAGLAGEDTSFDFHCPFIGLPAAFGTDLGTVPANVPYLRAPRDRIAHWRARLPATTARRVGIVWSGNPLHCEDHWRSIPLKKLEPLLAVPGVQLLGLQCGVRAADAAMLAAAGFVNLGEEVRDFADTAAIVSQLDLVISVDSAVAHLAGALAKPLWIMLHEPAEWRWLTNRDDSPWYPTARLFRQSRPGDWDGVIARIVEGLAEAPTATRAMTARTP